MSFLLSKFCSSHIYESSRISGAICSKLFFSYFQLNIYCCQRYDLQGKSVLKTQEKFYLADASLKYCIMGFNPKSIASMLENIVYFELRRRGYDVYIGKL